MLTGGQTAGKGLIDLYLYKRALRDFIRTAWLPKLALPSHIIACLLDMTRDIESFREKMGYNFNQSFMRPAKMDWRAGWRGAANMVLEFIEVPQSVPFPS